MLIFGKDVELKTRGCNRIDCAGGPIGPSVNLFVKITNRCNAACAFCSNAACRGQEPDFDLPKLVAVIRELRDKGVRVNRVNVTGGEPSVVPDRVQELLKALSSREFSDLHLHLNTNGVTEQSKRVMRFSRWNSISMSLHHYDPGRLAEIYGLPNSASVLELEGVDRNILNMSCNLMRGYIDSSLEVRKMLDFALEMRVLRIGFVALMKLNDYCREHFVDLEEVGIGTIPNVHFTESRNRGEDCKCSNYLYSNEKGILEIYLRNYANPYYCESSLLFDGQYLRQGFHKDNIIF